MCLVDVKPSSINQSRSVLHLIGQNDLGLIAAVCVGSKNLLSRSELRVFLTVIVRLTESLLVVRAASRTRFGRKSIDAVGNGL